MEENIKTKIGKRAVLVDEDKLLLCKTEEEVYDLLCPWVEKRNGKRGTVDETVLGTLDSEFDRMITLSDAYLTWEDLVDHVSMKGGYDGSYHKVLR